MDSEQSGRLGGKVNLVVIYMGWKLDFVDVGPTFGILNDIPEAGISLCVNVEVLREKLVVDMKVSRENSVVNLIDTWCKECMVFISWDVSFGSRAFGFRNKKSYVPLVTRN